MRLKTKETCSQSDQKMYIKISQILIDDTYVLPVQIPVSKDKLGLSLFVLFCCFFSGISCVVNFMKVYFFTFTIPLFFIKWQCSCSTVKLSKIIREHVRTTEIGT